MAKVITEVTEKPINSILLDWKKGQINLPEIQREYVWDRSQVAKLIDSLYSDFPIGTLLIWKNQDKYLLLDGQQRIASLFRVIETPRDSKDYIDIIFNVVTEETAVYNPTYKFNPFWVRVHEIVNSRPVELARKIEEKINESGRTEAYNLDDIIEKLVNLRDALQIKKIPVFTVTTDTDNPMEAYEIATEVFTRINAAGTKLNILDIILAWLSFGWVELHGEKARFRDGINLQLTLLEENYGFKISPKALIRQLMIDMDISPKITKSTTKKLGPAKFDAEKFNSVWENFPKRIEEVITYLKTIGIVTSAVIGYEPILHPLYEIVGKEGLVNLSDLDKKKLELWVFSVMAAYYFASAVESKLEQNFLEIKKNGVDGLINILRREVGTFPVTIQPSRFERSRPTGALYSIYIKALWENQSKDFVGIPISDLISIDCPADFDLHHIFPRSELQKYYGEAFNRYVADEIANLVPIYSAENRAKISNKLPADYLSEMVKEGKEDYIKSMLIPLNTDLWEIREFENFLAARRELISKSFNAYIRKLGEEVGFRSNNG